MNTLIKKWAVVAQREAEVEVTRVRLERSRSLVASKAVSQQQFGWSSPARCCRQVEPF